MLFLMYLCYYVCILYIFSHLMKSWNLCSEQKILERCSKWWASSKSEITAKVKICSHFSIRTKIDQNVFTFVTYIFQEQHLTLHITSFCPLFSKQQRQWKILGCSSGMVEVGKYYIYWEKKTTEQDETADLGIPQFECDDQGIVLWIIQSWL